MLYVGAIVLAIILMAVIFVFSSDLLQGKAPGIVNDFISGLPDAIEKATQRCGGHKTLENCRNDSACEWCETEDENQNTFLFCTTKKYVAEYKCAPPA